VAFRVVARSFGGVGLACTDLLSPEGLMRGTDRSLAIAATTEGDSPLAMQLYGANVEPLCEAARWAEDNGADVVDINMGCPVDKVTKKNGGLEAAVRPGQHPPDGRQDQGVAPPGTADVQAAARVGRLVHRRPGHGPPAGGRRRRARHHPRPDDRDAVQRQARLDGIAEVVAAVKHIPVIGNGDVKTPQDAERMIAHTRCAGVMIGRAALSHPWLFRDTWSYLTTGVIPEPPTIQRRSRPCGRTSTSCSSSGPSAAW
jgi:tRNA-dihydrouridine synthase